MSALVRRFATLVDMADAAAARFCAAAAAAVAARGRFCAIVPGGRTPAALYRALREAPWRTLVPWHASHFFLSDERCVPPDDRASNFGLLERELLAHIPAVRGHAVPVDAGAPAEVAHAWEQALRAFFSMDASPRFDLAVLGVGADGHTASIFPGAESTADGAWTAAVSARGTPPVPRVTLTLPLLGDSREALFIAAGADKAPVVAAIEARDAVACAQYPAASVRPHGAVTWYFAEAER